MTPTITASREALAQSYRSTYNCDGEPEGQDYKAALDIENALIVRGYRIVRVGEKG